MKLKTAINAALNGNAILFAGSGFSYGARNWRGEQLPLGNGLRDRIANACGITHTDSPLSSVADYYLSDEESSEESLIELLYNIFTLGQVSDSHKIILGLNWKRIYTTNYDQVIETAAKANEKLLKTVTIENPVEIYGKQGVCVHLNGSITNLTKENLRDTFKLTDRSYDYDTLVGKPWYEFMERDFASAKAIIIVGFSMQSDIDIKRIIARREVANRVVFVIGPESDPIALNTLSKYADVETIGIDGFAAKILEAQKKFVPSILPTFEFSCFSHEYMIPVEKCTASLSDLTSFYYLGIINHKILQKDSTGGYKSIVLRDAVQYFLKERTKRKVFLAISSIGNGKTVLCHLIRNELREKDVDVFLFEKKTVDIDAEIQHICQDYRDRSKVIIIDDYYKFLDVLQLFGTYSDLKKTTFLLTSRTSKLAANYRRLIQALHIEESDICPLYINTLSSEEEKQFAYTLSKNKLMGNIQGGTFVELAEFISSECKSCIGNVVLSLFDSSYMKEELEKLYSSAVDDDTQAMKELTVAVLASEVMNLRLSLDDITLLLDIDYISLRISESELINEVFETQLGGYKIASPIIARKFVHDIISIETLLDVLLKLIKGADMRSKGDRLYTETMKAIISHTNFAYWIQKGDSISEIKKFYDNLRMISFFADKNPFYWEQYASICVDAKDYVAAKQCLNIAFSEAKKIADFTPFQVETVYARMLLCNLIDKNMISPLPSETIRKTICEASARLFKYYDHPEDDHYYVFQLYNTIVSIINESVGLLSFRDASILLEDMVKAKKLLLQYQESRESQFYPATGKHLLALNDCIAQTKRRLSSVSV